MKQGDDILASFRGLLIIHQKIRGHAIETHKHDEDHEFFLPLQGEITVSVEGRELKAGPGRMIYIPPDEPHSFAASLNGEGERLITIVNRATWQRHQGGAFPASVFSVSQLGKELLFHLLLHPETKAAQSLTATLIETWSEMLEVADTGTRTADLTHIGGLAKDPRLKTALALIERENSSAISMDEVARQAGLSVRSMNRLFLNEIGMTPKHVMTLHRIERAKQLLSRSRTTVTDVAMEVGYSSVSQFITTFRKITGRLPSEFQRH